MDNFQRDMRAFLTLPLKDLFRPDEVAAYFSVSRQTIYKWIREGRLQAVGPRRALRITRASIISMINDTLSAG